MPPTAAPAPPAGRPAGGGLAGLLRTREGKIVAGGGAALLVVILALARGGRGGTGGPFVAESLQTGPDETLRDRLDQLGLRGGSLEELIGSTSDLTRGVADLTDRIDGLAPPKPPPASGGKGPSSTSFLQRYGVLGQSYGLRQVAARYAPDPSNPNSVEAFLRKLVAANPGLRGKTTLPGGYALTVPAGGVPR